MPNKTKRSSEESYHGEEEPKPIFGPDYQDEIVRPVSEDDDADSSDDMRVDMAHGGRQRPGAPGQRGRSGIGRSMFDRRQGRDEDHGRREAAEPRQSPDHDQSRAASPEELDEREPAGGVSDRGAVSPEESDVGDFGRDVDLASEIAGGRLGRIIKFLGRNKRKAAAGGITGGIISAIILLFGIAQGPLQIIHMGETLARSFSSQDDASNNRMGKLLRWARTGDPGETRLGVLQSQIAKRAEIKLKERGIEFTRDPATGQMIGARIDQEKNPTYKGLSEAEFKRQYAADNGISPDKVFKVGETGGTDGKGPIWRINTRDIRIDGERSIIRAGFDSADFGKLARAVAFRPVAEKLGKPSILHPWKRIKYSFEQKAADRVKAARERQLKVTERSPDAKALAEKLRDKVGESEGVRKAANIGLGLDLGICLARDFAEAFPATSRGNIVMPAATLAADGLAQGSQTKVGDDFSAHQPGDEALNYPDKNGLTPWSAMAIQALEGKENPGGVDLPDKYKTAFSSSSTAADIKNGLDAIGAGYLCSPVGNILTTVAGIALIATGPGKFAEKAVSGIGSAVVTSAVLYALGSLVTELANDKPPVTTLAGALGGNFAAFGSRELANMDYRSAGGVEMSPSEEALLNQHHRQIEKQELASKSFAQRIFDPYDSRSLVANIIDRQSINISQNLSSLANSFIHPSGLFSAFSSTLFPKATAASSKNYDWGDFRLYGFTLAQLNSNKYENSRENADKTGVLLDGSDSDDYIDRVEECFGVGISKGPDGWDAKKEKDVNPNSAEYQAANCKDDSEDWIRIRFFIFDTSLAKGAVCYEGDDERICDELGFNKDSSGGGSGSDVSGTLVGEFAWPVPEKYVKSNWDWFTKPHHDHPSSDIPVPEGTDVYSVTNGKVVYVCEGDCGGYGYVIAIDYKDGLFRYQHGHPGSIKVKVGDEVEAGQLIMKSGNTGFSTGPHLHVSIESGGDGASARTTEHCPQALWVAMKANDTRTLSEPFSRLPTSGCVGGASLY